MAINHRKGYKSVEEAERSKAFRMTPGATIDTGCACGQVHVNMMGQVPAPSPPAPASCYLARCDCRSAARHPDPRD